jgi:XTP/dITP diphosphohydrolase
MRRFDGPALVVATHNAEKLAEIAALIRPFGVIVTASADHGLPEPAETETTFLGNARIKARAAAIATGLPALADDSGVEVVALQGAPGVRTADWAEGPSGRDYRRAMRRVWDALETQDAPEPRRARFCATLVLAWPDGTEAVAEGTVAGRIVWPPRGVGGHGYDPIFQPDGHAETFAEMDPVLKNRISHRAVALTKLIGACFG